MTQNAQVIKHGSENNASLLRRFSREVQGSGALQEVRKHRYYQKPLSKQLKKQKKLEHLKRAARIRWLVKLGFLPDKQR